MSKSASQQRIAEAVHDDNWQKFRASLKGVSTAGKIDMLERYYDVEIDYLEHALKDETIGQTTFDEEVEFVKIRIDNYIKALCRGGQLEAGMTFDHFNDGCIRNHIKK